MRTIKQEHFFPAIILIHFVFWGIDLFLYKGDYQYSAQHIIGEIFSSWVITVFAINFLMATRAHWIEKIFGGLDKMYMIHRRAGTLAVILLILHFITVPKTLEYTIGKPLGFFSMILILIGVVLSVAPVFKKKLKYHKWIKVHKLMGLFYIMGIAHSLNVPTLIAELPIVRTYVLIMSLIGVFAWFYKTFLFNLFNKKLDYTIDAIQNFSNDTTELLLSPANKKLHFNAGQFAFISIKGMNNNEAHPFTISNNNMDEHLRFTIKSLGDYTSQLQSSIKKGMKVKIQGAYGVFNFKKAKHKKQLWLAGGIGITPFLSFLQEPLSDYDITLVWSVNSLDEANYKNEIEQAVAKNSRLKFVIWNSDEKGFFSIDKLYDSSTIKNHSVFICGAEVMRESYIKQLNEKGISIKDIHYEEFSFR